MNHTDDCSESGIIKHSWNKREYRETEFHWFLYQVCPGYIENRLGGARWTGWGGGGKDVLGV